METDDDKIKIKVRNTLDLKEIHPNVLGWVEKRSAEELPFRGHYYTPYELTADIKLIEDPRKQNELIVWLKKQKTKDLVIEQAIRLCQVVG